MNLLYLSFFAAIALNSTLSLGFGLGLFARGGSTGLLGAAVPALSALLAGVVVYPLFAFALSPFALGILENFLLLPVVALCCVLVEFLLKPPAGKSKASAITGFDGIVYATSYMVLRFSSNMVEALAFSFGSALGVLLCSALLDAVRERAEAEPIPSALRGAPLVVLASGILALCSVFVAASLYAALGGQ